MDQSQVSIIWIFRGKFQKEDFSDLVELMVAIFKENIGPISNDVTAVVVVVVAFFWCHTGRRKIFAIYF